MHLLRSGGNTTVLVNADGVGSDFVALATLQGVAYSNNLLSQLISDGNLVMS